MQHGGEVFHAMPQSLPLSPPQLEQDTYGPAELGLFKTYSRDSYRAAFGLEAPAYDPARLIKTWFDSTVDSSDASNIALYRIIAADGKGQWGYRQMVLPAPEAATVNLPGPIPYPPYLIVSTTATRAGATLWPDRLSLESDARALVAELGITTSLYDTAQNPSFPVLYGDEPRREWAFLYLGSVYNAGGLLRAKNEQGIGAPGHWQVADTITWIADPPTPAGFDDQRPPRPMPVRELLSNETLGQTLMGPVIVRTDRRQTNVANSALGDAGQFTAGDRAMLREIRDLLTQPASK